MPLTLERIEEIRHTTGHHQSRRRYTDAEMAALCDAAEAWELYAKAQGYHTESGSPCQWLLTDRGLYGTFQTGSHPTPQAAVMAALRKP